MLRMPLPQLPPNPSLLAILLLVNTGGGPNLIFHYPPDPLTYKNTASTRHREVAHGSEQTESNSSPSSSEAAWSSDEELEEGLDDINETRSRTSRTSTNSRRLPTRNSARHGAFSSSRSAGSKGPELETDDYEGYSRQPYSDRANANLDGEDVEWTHLLGYSIKSLEALLSPRASFHKKKFEVCLDNTIFLSCPIFAKSGGGWRKRRRKRTSKKEGSKSSDTQSTPQNNERLEKYSTTSDEVVFEETDEEEDGEGEEVDEGRAEGRGVDGDGERLGREGKEQKEQGGGGRKEAGRAEQKIPSSIRGSRNLSDEGSETKSNSSVGADEDLSMFNVVFVLSPPSLEYRIRVTDIYQNVAKKFAKALKYEQKRSGYMSKQTRKILAWKDKGRDSNTTIGKLWPRIIESSALAKSIFVLFDSISNSKIAHTNINTFDASLQIPQAVSTAVLPTSREPQVPGLWLTTANLIDDDSESTLSPHCALLLLEDPETLLKEIEGDTKELLTPLAFYVQQSTPTKSLKKISSTSMILLSDIQYLARHLIYWRRARAIPPLHPRDVYIVSPIADMTALRTSIPAYAARFPTFPSLTDMLHRLSIMPRPYATFIPSKYHKAAYLEILAWLMRGGWVTQLRTFAWIKVSAEIKQEVALQTKAAAAEANEKDNSGKGRSAVRLNEMQKSAVQDGGRQHVKSDKNDAQQNTTSRRRSVSPTESTSSSRTARVISDQDEGLPKTSRDHDFQTYSASLILSPPKADAMESRWLDAIRSKIRDHELRDLWSHWIHYFDGKHALEEIAAREGVKRGRVAHFINLLKEMDIILTVSHW